jgi:hypothetical protein
VSSSIGAPLEAKQGVTAAAELPVETPGLFARIGTEVRRWVVVLVTPKRGFEPEHPHDGVIGAGTVATVILFIWVAFRQRFGRPR